MPRDERANAPGLVAPASRDPEQAQRPSGNIHRGFIAPCGIARVNHGAISRSESQNIP